jgi:hypothetical protein
MTESGFEKEDLLQELLEKYPEILAGDQMDAAESRRWLLIARELGVPDYQDAADRWSLDHLFVDQDGIPTLVEVKRSSDTRIRREVVGQLLDYAANAVVYWPPEMLRARFEAGCELRKEDPADVICRFLGEPEPSEHVPHFWEQVKTNLQAGRIRLVFLADQIPAELKRIVEFLNGQMDPAEVLAVEVRQFVGDNLQTLVPQVIGLTAAAEQKKAGSQGRISWDEGTFLQSASTQWSLSAQDLLAVKKLLDFSVERSDDPGWGTGRVHGSFSPKFRRISTRSLYTLRANGDLTLNFDWLVHTEAERNFRDRLAAELRSIPAFSSIAKNPVGYPGIGISKWAPEVERFIEVINKLVN